MDSDTRYSCQIIVRLAIFASFQVISFYEAFNPFFDIIRDWEETTGQLSCHLMGEVDVSHVLSILHDAHDAGLNLVTPFLVDSITCFFPFIASLHLGYDSADLDLPEIGSNLVIK